MAQEWEIGGRSRKCSASGKPFEEGEVYHTLLFREKGGFRRDDLCEEAFRARSGGAEPFSFWKGSFETHHTEAAPEALPRESAEDLLRRFVEDDRPEHGNVRYILALMLERKRQLRQVDTRQTEDGKLLIYEHVKTGEVFFIVDPELRLDQMGPVQDEVSALLTPATAAAGAGDPVDPPTET